MRIGAIVIHHWRRKIGNQKAMNVYDRFVNIRYSIFFQYFLVDYVQVSHDMGKEAKVECSLFDCIQFLRENEKLRRIEYFLMFILGHERPVLLW